MKKTIRVIRSDGQDAMLAATKAAQQNGVVLEGNMRWRGVVTRHHREIGTQDGRTVAVYEPGTPESDIRF